MSQSKRIAKIDRKTNETTISIEMNLDGTGCYDIDTGVGFFDHMLTHLSKHSGIDLTVKATGDLEVDAHHTVEDIGLALGECLCKSLGDKRGLVRYGDSSIPMEDALCLVALDLSGRARFIYNVEYMTEKIGDFDVELIDEFLVSFANSGKLNLHVNVAYGTNSHHIAESIFKAIGRALGQAIKVTGKDIPSTKGVL